LISFHSRFPSFSFLFIANFKNIIKVLFSFMISYNSIKIFENYKTSMYNCSSFTKSTCTIFQWWPTDAHLLTLRFVNIGLSWPFSLLVHNQCPIFHVAHYSSFSYSLLPQFFTKNNLLCIFGLMSSRFNSQIWQFGKFFLHTNIFSVLSSSQVAQYYKLPSANQITLLLIS
jgi:hypothetical protein